MIKKILPKRASEYLITKLGGNLEAGCTNCDKLNSGNQKLERALIRAKKTQEAILPPERDITFQDYEISGNINSYYRIGGDYFDWIIHDENRLGLSLADVSGKGMESTPVTSSIHAVLDVTSRISTKNIASYVQELNNFLVDHTPTNMFATLIYGELSKEGFRYVSGGHEPILHYSQGQVTFTRKGNMALGVLPNLNYDIFNLRLEKGDIMLLYSDGITDTINRNFPSSKGVESLTNILKEKHKKPAREILNEIFNFLGDFEQTDDQTGLVVKRT
ncbi:MAG: PP2C family protein-serine/threonine phosphatase [archaeon]